MAIWFVIGIVSFIISVTCAIEKNRNPAGWGLLSLLLPVIGVTVILCLPALPEVRRD